MLYANSSAVQDRVNAYVRKPSLAPTSAQAAARLEPYSNPASLNRVALVNAAISELSALTPED